MYNNNNNRFISLWQEFSTELGTVSRKEKGRSMYVTSSDSNIQASSTGDRNGSIVKVPPTQVVSRDTSAGQVPAETRTIMSQRCDELSLKSCLFHHLRYDALFRCIVIVAVSCLPLCM